MSRLDEAPPRGTIHMGWGLRKIRTKKGLTQEEFADKLGVRQGEVSKFESRASLRAATVMRMARALGVSPEDILRAAGG